LHHGHEHVQVLQLHPISDAIAQLHDGTHFLFEMISSDNSLVRLWWHQLSSQAEARRIAGNRVAQART
jgi:hypothetical protein